MMFGIGIILIFVGVTIYTLDVDNIQDRVINPIISKHSVTITVGVIMTIIGYFS